MATITCIVDNAVQHGSAFWGEHGLSMLIETDQGKVLLDTGGSASVLLHNLGLLGYSRCDVDALVLSHAHSDHTGGLSAVLASRPGLPVYAHPDLFRPRFSVKNEQSRSMGLSMTREELAQAAELHLCDAPAEILPHVTTTGEILQRPEPEGRSPRHVVPAQDGWQPDPYRDDLSLTIETQDGLVVICGCCHAGLLNTLAHVRHVFRRPITAIIGGTHLVDAEGAYLAHVAGVLREEYGSPRLFLNHCTGERAYVALTNAFGERVRPCPAGATLTFT